MDMLPHFDHHNGQMGVPAGSGNGSSVWRRAQPPPQPLPQPPQSAQQYGSNDSLPHQDGYHVSGDLLRDFTAMRPANGFGAQQDLTRLWFQSWSPAERLVSFTSLLEYLSDTQVTLLKNILQARLQHKPGLLMKEARANKPEVVYRECAVCRPEQAGDFLRDHLPLLALTNHEAKPLYLNGVLLAVRSAIKSANAARLEQARQLLGLLAVHPVLTRDDRRAVHGLFREFAEAGGAAEAAAVGLASPDRRPGGHLLSEQRRHSACAAFGADLRVPSPAYSPPQDASGWQNRNLLSPRHASETPLTTEQQQQQQQRLRSSSLTPPGTYPTTNDIPQAGLLVPKPRSSSIHLDHSPLLPAALAECRPGSACEPHQNAIAQLTLQDGFNRKGLGSHPHRSSSHSSLSDISRDKAFSIRGSGTTTVPKWLHKLRLHKYTWIFAGMAYEEMFELTMEKLLRQGVTQGGANKLLRNVHELNERPQKLRELEQALAENKVSLAGALEVMQVMVVSPMRAHKPRLTASAVQHAATSSAGTPLIRVTRSDDSGEPEPESEPEPADVDLQALITRVLAKMCTQLLVAQTADDEAIQTFLWVLDEATWHEAFTDAQRRKFVTWKRRISLELGRRQVFPQPFRRHSDARQYHSQRRHSDVRGYRRFPVPGVSRVGAGYPAPSIGYWGAGAAVSPPVPPPLTGCRPSRGGLGATPPGFKFARRPSLQDSVLEIPSLSSSLYRTNSGDIYRPSAVSPFSTPPPPQHQPPRPSPLPPALPPSPPPSSQAQRLDSLESICRSVCETALK